MKSMDDAGVKYRDSRKSQGKPILQTKQQNSKLQNDDSIDFGKKKFCFLFIILFDFYLFTVFVAGAIVGLGLIYLVYKNFHLND